jgi:hypothetical protein
MRLFSGYTSQHSRLVVPHLTGRSEGAWDMSTKQRRPVSKSTVAAPLQMLNDFGQEIDTDPDQNLGIVLHHRKALITVQIRRIRQ